MGIIPKEEGTRPWSKRNKLQLTQARRLKDKDLELKHAIPIQGCTCMWLIILTLLSQVNGITDLKLSTHFNVFTGWDSTNFSAWVHLGRGSLEELSLPSQIIKMSKGFEPRVVFLIPVVFCRDRRERKDEENWKSISETSITFQIS